MQRVKLTNALLLVSLWSTPVSAMDVRVSGDTIYMTGRVEGQDYERFIKVFNSSVRRVVFVNSPGG